MTTKSDSLDIILTQLGSKFGMYQLKNYFFISIPMVFSAMFTLSYVFTARNLNYRCYISECDTSEPTFNPWWLPNAVPFTRNQEPSRCERFFPRDPPLNITNDDVTCPATMFSHNTTERCGIFIFSTEDVTILNDFDLMCEENLWKLTLVGTINNIGELTVQPITGFISDRYGRRFRMLAGLLVSTVVGVCRSLSPSYIWFLLFEYLDTGLGSGAFGCGFILGLELVSPDKRVFSSMVISSAYALGVALLGLIAMYTNSWRHLLRMIYLPGILLLSLFWLMPESLRWMLAKGRNEEVKSHLRKAAKMNHVELSEELLDSLDHIELECEKETKTYPIGKVFKSRILFLRLATCSFCWITCAFVYFGLTLNSVAVSGSIYLNFIFVALVEIPGYITSYLVLDRWGRRFCLCTSLLLSGSACLAFIFIPDEIPWVKLVTFLIGKFAITIAYTAIYVFTTELFPTPLRHSMLSTCSMFARIGSMTAPQTPLLGQVLKSLPLILFGGMCVLSGFLCLTLPETINIKLPDTILEAENIKQRSRYTEQNPIKNTLISNQNNIHLSN